MKNTFLRLCVVSLLFIALSGCGSIERNAREIEGSWSLVSVESVFLDGEVTTEWMGKSPTGIIQYHRDGNMSVHFMRDPRPTFTPGQVSDEVRTRETESALSGYYAYWGTYEIDETTWTVKHHVVGSLNPGEVGTAYTRFAMIEGDRLVITTTVYKRRGRDCQNRITFKRASRATGAALYLESKPNAA